MTSLYLIRHGAYDHRSSPLGEAASDFGLSELGRRQATALRDRLTRSGEIRADALFCSTLPRAAQTAATIAPALRLEPRARPDLCEWESGNEALGVDAFMDRFRALPADERRDHRFHPGCETIAEFAGRVHATLSALVADYDGGTIAIVAHGGVIEAAFSYFVGAGAGLFDGGGYPAAAHTSITLWRRSISRGAGWVQEFANDTRHLEGIE